MDLVTEHVSSDCDHSSHGPYGQAKGLAIRLYFAVVVGTLNRSMSYIVYTNITLCLSQFPRSLKHRSAAAHLLR